ncbi:hypothetical protein Bca52824_023482 [Brassica carinata]|uniref:Ubiquitin-like protease family profile domain-containing protein n=1 Tax=Brassica carinata TaxID=52824 RepID=A0A8X7VJ54_BRACI|nr:hypothetical protein Bca52824_023482 [Brassica carinata]
MEFPRSMFSDETRPAPMTEIQYGSTFKALKAVKNVVGVNVWKHVENSPLGVIIKFLNLEFEWCSKLVHYVTSRQLYCKKLHEFLFLIEKQPARFSIFEFEDIKGLNCDTILNTKITVTCMCPRSRDEVRPLWEQQDEDPEIDRLFKYILQDKPLSTITWQALPKYPLTPIQCNKQTEEQKESHEEQFIIQRRKTQEERVEQLIKKWNSGKRNMDHQSYQFLNLIAQLEDIMLFKTPQNDRSSCTKLPAKLAKSSKIEDTTGKTEVQGNGGDQDPGNGGHKEEELPFEVEDIDVVKSPPQPHLCLLVPKIEETSESKKKPDDEKAIIVSSESHPFARMEKTEKENHGATSSASVTSVLPCKDLEDQVVDRRRMRLQYQALHPPPKIDRTRTLSQNLKSPYVPGTQVKEALKRYRMNEMLREPYMTVYGPVAESDVANLRDSIGREDSIYPIGSTTRANTFFKLLLQPRKRSTGEASDLTFDTSHMNAALCLYRLRLREDPSMFISSRIAIMDVNFQMLWAHQYKNWESHKFLNGGSGLYYFGIAPFYAQIKLWWMHDVDTLFSYLNVHDNSHWVAMVISIPDQTVKIYDSGEPEKGNIRLREEAEPFARMLPYALWFFAKAIDKPICGSYRVYNQVYMEMEEHLNDDKIAVVREKLAAEMYVATARGGEEMSNDEFITNSMDENQARLEDI